MNKRRLSWLGLLGGFALLLNLSGCIVHGDRGDRGPYHYDHGDRIDRYGHRDVGWCNQHADDENCRH